MRYETVTTSSLGAFSSRAVLDEALAGLRVLREDENGQVVDRAQAARHDVEVDHAA
jgi:hypothetical protein